MAITTFEKVMEKHQDFTVIDTKGKEYHGIWSDIRVDRTTLPEGWNAYDIRENEWDDGDFFGTIEENYVYVNHLGTFCTQETLPLVNGVEGRHWANFGHDSNAGDFDYSFN